MKNKLQFFKMILGEIKKESIRFLGISGICFSLLSPENLLAASGFWINSDTDDWNVPANWSSGTVPNGVGEGAAFVLFPNSGRTITSSSNITIGHLEVVNTLDPITFNFGANTLTFDNGADPAPFFVGSHIDIRNPINAAGAGIEFLGNKRVTLKGFVSSPGVAIALNSKDVVVRLDPTIDNDIRNVSIVQGTLGLNGSSGVNAINAQVSLETTRSRLIFNQSEVANGSAITCLGGTVLFNHVTETISLPNLIMNTKFLEIDNNSQSTLFISGPVINIGSSCRISLFKLEFLSSPSLIILLQPTGEIGSIDGSSVSGGITNIVFPDSLIILASALRTDKDLVLTNVHFSGGSLQVAAAGILAFENTKKFFSIIPDLFLQNGGTVSIGTKERSADVHGTTINITNGLLNGFGIFRGSVENSDRVNPGNPTTISDTFRVGNYTQTAIGNLLIKGYSNADGERFADKLTVLNQANLDGTLNFDLLPGSTFINGEEITILEAKQINGRFSTVNFNLNSGLQAELRYTAQKVIIRFSAICPCPCVQPPVCLKGKQVFDCCHKDPINLLTWQPSPSGDVKAYRIYRDGKRIGTVKASATLSFEDDQVKKDKRYHYAVTAVSDDNFESKAAKITLPTSQQNCTTGPSQSELTDFIKNVGKQPLKQKK